MANKIVKQPKKGGRPRGPSAIQESHIKKLEDAFRQGTLVDTAVNYAGVARRTFFDRMEKDEVFRTRINEAREFSRLAAGNVVMQDIVKKKNVETAKWWLEKKYRKEFGPAPPALIKQNIQQNLISKEIKNDDLSRITGELPQEI